MKILKTYCIQWVVYFYLLLVLRVWNVFCFGEVFCNLITLCCEKATFCGLESFNFVFCMDFFGFCCIRQKDLFKVNRLFSYSCDRIA